MSHHPRTNGEKMGAVLPVYFTDFHEAQVNLIDESGSLQRVACSLSGHVAVCGAVKLVIDERCQLFQGGFVSGAPGPEQCGDIGNGRH